MSPDLENGSHVRSEYAFLFSALAKLYELRCDKKISTKFDDIKKAVLEMENNGFLSEYLRDNLQVLFSMYPELYPTKVAADFKEDAGSEKKKLSNISQLVTMITGDVCGEIHEITSEFEKAETESFLKRINAR